MGAPTSNAEGCQSGSLLTREGANEELCEKLDDIHSVCVSNGAFLCAEKAITMNTKMQGIYKAFGSGCGVCIMECSGVGHLALSCLGACVRYDLGPGEQRQVDNGHLVAWRKDVQYQVGLGSRSIFGSFASGEAIMCTFTGPGPVWIQTHKGQEFAGKIKSKSNGGASNLVGTVIALLLVFVFICCGVFCFIEFADNALQAFNSGDNARKAFNRGSGYIEI